MSNAPNYLIEQFAKLGFDYQKLAPSHREIHQALSVYETKIFDSRTARPTDYFHFAFELWRKTPDDPLKIACLSVGLIGQGPHSKEDLLASGYYHIDQSPIPPMETIIKDLLTIQKRIEASRKFNMGGDSSPSPQPRQNPGKRRKR